MNVIASTFRIPELSARKNSVRRCLTMMGRCLFLALSLWLSACATPPIPLPSRTPSRPARFKAFFSDRFGTIQSVELRGDTVISTVQGSAFRDAIYGPIQREQRVRPNESQWQAFRAALDRADVWAWQSSYKNAEFTGGPAWSFEIVYPKRRVITAGFASYPSDKTPLQSADAESRRFQIVESAVERLIGRRLFN